MNLTGNPLAVMPMHIGIFLSELLIEKDVETSSA
jgi:hypothetical protein